VTKFEVTDGKPFEWKDPITVPNVESGAAALEVEVEVVDPTDCYKYGCARMWLAAPLVQIEILDANSQVNPGRPTTACSRPAARLRGGPRARWHGCAPPAAEAERWADMVLRPLVVTAAYVCTNVWGHPCLES